MARRKLNWRQRKQLGVTFPNILAAAKAIKQEDPEGFADMSDSELSAAILTRILPVSGSAVGIDWENIDWEALILFIERLIELILKLIEGLS